MRKLEQERMDRAYRRWINTAPTFVKVMIDHEGSTVDCALCLAFRGGMLQSKRTKKLRRSP